MNKLKFILPLILATITLVTYSPIEAQASTTQYNLVFQDSTIYFNTSNLTSTPSSSVASTIPQEIINNSIIIDDTSYISIIVFWDVNQNLISQLNISGSNANIIIPNNAYYFSLRAWKTAFDSPFNRPITFSNFQTTIASYTTSAPAVLDFIMQDTNFSGLISIRNTENITQPAVNGVNRYAHVLEITHPSTWEIDNIFWLWEVDLENINNSTLISNQESLKLATITSGNQKVTYIYNIGDAFSFSYYEEIDFHGVWLLLTGSGVFDNATSSFATSVVAFAPDNRSIREIESEIDFQNRTLTIVAPSGTTFDNGSSQISLSQINEFSEFDLPEPPSREGFVFDYWQLERNIGTVLDPIYDRHPYTIVNRADGKTIYHFYDFSDNSPSEVGSIRLEPIYTQLQQYLVTFVDYDGTPISSSMVIQGQSATLPPNPSRTGYTFSHWEPPVSDIQGNITTVAQYTPNQYTVTWRDTNFSTLKIETVLYSGLATAPTIQGFTQLQWSPNPNQPISENTTFVLVSSTPISSLPSPTSLTDLFTAVLGASVGSILTLGTIDLFGIQLSSLIYLFIFGSLALTFLKIIRGN